MYKIVEVVIRKKDGCVPVGLMNVGQALRMPKVPAVEFSHPAFEAGETDVFIDRDMLSELMPPGRPAGPAVRRMSDDAVQHRSI
ncbi:hypothetical protein [Rhizobium sp. LCM 4573]|uniref:hypothetical protein n=1 Tax=Rhizobium sp. LCM 4573 TaxID=1848291 RepID=UPI0008DA3370|nr:hypothetical protein [Rhizobium sp. LCM 4573]OHV79096.1 hypothetical protein LCM4573_07685 [Rhizobium sp. LCM 4573]